MNNEIKKDLDEFISKNYEKLVKMAKNVCKNENYEDILHNTIIAVYEIKEDKLLNLMDNNILDYYIFGILTNKKRDTWKEIEKKRMIFDENNANFDYGDFDDDETPERQEKENLELKMCEVANYILSDRRLWFENRIFIDMVNKKYKSFRDFSKATGIHYSTLWHAYKRTEKRLRIHFLNQSKIVSQEPPK